MEIVDLLAQSELFHGFDEEALDEVAAAAEARSLRRNDMVFAESDPPDALYVVRSGRIAMANTSVDGRESVIALMEAGDLFGEYSNQSTDFEDSITDLLTLVHGANIGAMPQLDQYAEVGWLNRDASSDQDELDESDSG